MLDKAAILKLIDDAYAARTRGDKNAVAKMWAPGATFRFVAQSLPPTFPDNPSHPQQSVETLIDLIKFEHLDRLDAVVDGSAAAVHWRVTFSVRNGQSATSELFDLWKFNSDGKAQSLLQFGDTALLNRMLES